MHRPRSPWSRPRALIATGAAIAAGRIVVVAGGACVVVAGCADPPAITAPAEVVVPEARAVEFAFQAHGAVSLTQTGTFDARFGDGDTVAITAPFGATGGRIELVANLGDDAATTTIDVIVTPLAFTRTTWTDDGPTPREHGALLVADDGASVFLLSGGAYPNYPTQEVLADAWRFDVDSGAWSAWDVTGDVPPAAGSRRTARAAGDIAYLYGGYDGDSVSLDDLYRVDLASGAFVRLAQSDARPKPRSLHAFGYDAAHERLIVSGGFSTDGVAQDILDDTWLGALDGDAVVWEELQGLGPPPRYGAFFGTDDARFVVVSGAGFPTASDPIAAYEDVWVLSLDDAPLWTELHPAGEAPRGRRNGCGVVDPITHGLLVFGGTHDGRTSEPGTFLLDLRGEGRWSSAARDDEPPLRSSAFGAALPGGGFLCGFGNDAATYQDLLKLR